MLRQLKFRDRLAVLAVIPLLVVAVVAAGLLIFADTSTTRPYGLFAVAGLVVAALIAVIVIRSILASVNGLADAAAALAESHRKLASGELSVEDLQPLPKEADDQLGRLAAAVNSINSATVEVSRSQQGAVKAGLSNIVVNLARRSQTLLDRQVEYLDRLESSEEDPDRLSELFKVDHLATRMRRNAESLMVLAEADPGRRRGGPVEIGDVLRVAMGEVEIYQNIELSRVDGGQVSAGTAVDLAHLTAELMENATQFSPPNTPVEVSGTFAGSDSFVVTIADSGIGLTEEKLAETNQLLANPPELGLGMGRSLGFMVIGRLAQRLDATVTLEPNGSSGSRAVVTIPAGLFLGRDGAADAAGPATTQAGATTSDSAPSVAEESPQLAGTAFDTAPTEAAAPTEPVVGVGPDAALPEIARPGEQPVEQPSGVGGSVPAPLSAQERLAAAERPTMLPPLSQPSRSNEDSGALPPSPLDRLAPASDETSTGATADASSDTGVGAGFVGSQPAEQSDPMPGGLGQTETTARTAANPTGSTALERLLGLTPAKPTESSTPAESAAPTELPEPTGTAEPIGAAQTNGAAQTSAAAETNGAADPTESEPEPWTSTGGSIGGGDQGPADWTASPFETMTTTGADYGRSPKSDTGPIDPIADPVSGGVEDLSTHRPFIPFDAGSFDGSSDSTDSNSDIAADGGHESPPAWTSPAGQPGPFGGLPPADQTEPIVGFDPNELSAGFDPLHHGAEAGADDTTEHIVPDPLSEPFTFSEPEPEPRPEPAPSIGSWTPPEVTEQPPGNLEQAIPSGDAFESGVASLLAQDPRPDADAGQRPLRPEDSTSAGLAKRQRGASHVPIGEGRPVASSKRDPEEVRSRLSRYREGLKGRKPNDPQGPETETDTRDR